MSYPVVLRLAGKRVVFVGGGRETELKVRQLAEAGADVLLISPGEHPPLPARWEKRAYREGDLEGAWLAFAHLPDPAGHAAVLAEAERRGIWCNCVDDPAHCAFTMPAVHRQGDLVLAISTGGAAPALAVRLRQRFEREYGPEYADFLRRARALRGSVAGAEAWYREVDGFLTSRKTPSRDA